MKAPLITHEGSVGDDGYCYLGQIWPVDISLDKGLGVINKTKQLNRQTIVAISKEDFEIIDPILRKIRKAYGQRFLLLPKSWHCDDDGELIV